MSYSASTVYYRTLTRKNTSQPWGISLRENNRDSGHPYRGYTIVLRTVPNMIAGLVSISTGSVIMAINGTCIHEWPMVKVVKTLSKATAITLTLREPHGKTTGLPTAPPTTTSRAAVKKTRNPPKAKKAKTGSSKKPIESKTTDDSSPISKPALTLNSLSFSEASHLAKESFTDEQYTMLETLTTIHHFNRQESIEAIKATPALSLQGCISFIQDRRFQEELEAAQVISKNNNMKVAAVVEDDDVENDSDFAKNFASSLLLPKISLRSNSKYEYIQKESCVIVASDFMTAVSNLESDNQLKDAFTKYLQLEAITIRWYDISGIAYAKKIAGDLSQFLADHVKVTTKNEMDFLSCMKSCCSRNTKCSYVARLREEASFLLSHLHSTPENSDGNIPIAFLNAHVFSLEEDGFEIID